MKPLWGVFLVLSALGWCDETIRIRTMDVVLPGTVPAYVEGQLTAETLRLLGGLLAPTPEAGDHVVDVEVRTKGSQLQAQMTLQPEGSSDASRAAVVAAGVHQLPAVLAGEIARVLLSSARERDGQRPDLSPRKAPPYLTSFTAPGEVHAVAVSSEGILLGLQSGTIVVGRRGEHTPATIRDLRDMSANPLSAPIVGLGVDSWGIRTSLLSDYRTVVSREPESDERDERYSDATLRDIVVLPGGGVAEIGGNALATTVTTRISVGSRLVSRTFEVSGLITAMAVDPQGHLWLYDASRGALRLLDTEGAEVHAVVPLLDRSVAAAVQTLAVYADLSFVLGTPDSLYGLGPSGTLRWTLSEIHPEAVEPLPLPPFYRLAADPLTGGFVLLDPGTARIHVFGAAPRVSHVSRAEGLAATASDLAGHLLLERADEYYRMAVEEYRRLRDQNPRETTYARTVESLLDKRQDVRDLLYEAPALSMTEAPLHLGPEVVITLTPLRSDRSVEGVSIRISSPFASSPQTYIGAVTEPTDWGLSLRLAPTARLCESAVTLPGAVAVTFVRFNEERRSYHPLRLLAEHRRVLPGETGAASRFLAGMVDIADTAGDGLADRCRADTVVESLTTAARAVADLISPDGPRPLVRTPRNTIESKRGSAVDRALLVAAIIERLHPGSTSFLAVGGEVWLVVEVDTPARRKSAVLRGLSERSDALPLDLHTLTEGEEPVAGSLTRALEGLRGQDLQPAGRHWVETTPPLIPTPRHRLPAGIILSRDPVAASAGDLEATRRVLAIPR